MFDIEEIISVIKDRQATSAGLQFPEGLKRKGPEIAKEIEKRTGITVIISGDPCYGACDIDEDLLEMVDVMFHFGHSRLLDDDRVVYIEYYHEVDVNNAVEAALPLLGHKVGVVTTVQHIHMMDRIIELLKKAGKEPVIQKGDTRIAYPGQVLGCNFTSAPKDVDTILFIGTGNFHPMGIRLSAKVPVVAADPFTGEARIVDVEKIMRQRYAVIAKAMDAKKWGIIIGMKSGQKRLELAQQLKGLAEDAVLISIREISADRLLSFKVDAYVSTVCPRVAIDDAGRFPVPVLTPVEFEILKGLRKWEDLVFDEIKD
ncbi:diphthamide biosynthesis enzyme Dph2 [Methanocella sp. CWC-04]|uniref:2-(3-amino-3-carboxypropyl)histidine synthase n=1 Tax=Methanooceanicella nereidis TaxID=2052831 RepID=A0AAP2W7F9_9EURY|nr:diphthamide biosynthesis enzyme Dph2 [Methanocella sp. CWC-04]MCD1295016.1 diphthamide biosynthesis enzyme Dph2 [Methanocella sp. CWC-04]